MTVRWSVAPGVHFTGTDDGAVLLDLASGRFLALNPTAAVVWRGLTSGSTIEEVAGELAATWGVDKERSLDDVLRLTTDLRERGVLVDAETDG
ncbi:PqqD family peptide modification chaperone [Nocardiopsis sp. CC223A]|uniref:PqqD family peptide modification chaperone n=1 Tax=Nocardiopsis sp. CC223A TaxID=3044051 RepID=UPI00278BDA45|nr:PqqD family peptide modification chaperone [Nocardiopsis sp. CC223A]